MYHISKITVWSQLNILKDMEISKTSKYSNNQDQKPELTLNEQKERLNALLVITGSILLLNVIGLTIKLIHEGVFSSPDKALKPIVLVDVMEIGMPTPHVAIFGDFGYVKDFTLFSPKLDKKFPKLPQAQVESEHEEHLSETFPLYQLFAVHHLDHIHFLSCNPNRLVTKVNLDNYLGSIDHPTRMVYDTIDGTYIPNSHTRYKIDGVQVGNYFWIIGGKDQRKTSIWVLNREHWITGPELPDIFTSIPRHFPVALNSSTVLFVSESHFIEFNFETNIWRMRNNPTDIDVHFTCQRFQDKNYTMFLVFIHGFFIKTLQIWDLKAEKVVYNAIATPAMTPVEMDAFMPTMNYMHQGIVMQGVH